MFQPVPVKHCDLPENSLLWLHFKTGDFLDCYVTDAVMTPRQAAEIITDFPWWARLLLMLRSVVVTPLGLLTDGPDAKDKVGPFPVQSETSEELIAGFNDAHLDFRVSVISGDGRVSLATWVHRHNLGGRIYLACIMPFHILVAHDALRRVARASRKNARISGPVLR